MQRNEPTMPAEVAQSLDPALVRRLWRPVERPGVIDPGPARALLARHQRMVAGLPLAELVSRHTGSTSDLDGATVPIVYALPSQAPPLPESRPREAQLGTAASTPIVPARPMAVPPARMAGAPTGIVVPPAADAAPAAQRSPSPGPSSVEGLPLDLPTSEPRSSEARPPRTGTVSTASGSATVDPGPPMVGSAQPLQSMPVPAPSDSPPSPSVPSGVAVTQDAASLEVQRRLAALPALGSIPATTSAPTGALPAEVAMASPGEVVPGGRSSPLTGARSADRLPLELPTSQPGHSDPVATAAGLTDPGPQQVRTPVDSRRVVPAGAITAELNGATSSAWADGSAAPLVVARPVAAAARSHGRPGEPLLLVDLDAVASRSARSRPVTGGYQEPAAGRAPGADRVPAPGAAPGTGQAAAPPRSLGPGTQAQAGPQTAAPLDVERIVDAVHRRFVRRLAIEAERRAVR